MAGVIRRSLSLNTRVFSLDSIEQRATKIVQSAERRASELIEQRRQAAELETQAERRRGFEQGVEEGRRAGLEEARAAATAAAADLRREAKHDLDRLLSVLGESIRQIDTERHRLLADAEAGLIQVALAIGRRVCGLAVRQDSATALAVSRELVQKIGQSGTVELRIHPADYESIQACAAELLVASGRCAHVAIVPDVEVPRGGARISSGDCQIDGAIETQLDRIAEVIVSGMERDSVPPIAEPSARLDAAIDGSPEQSDA